jgi:hypothetical protein
MEARLGVTTCDREKNATVARVRNVSTAAEGIYNGKAFHKP